MKQANETADDLFSTVPSEGPFYYLTPEGEEEFHRRYAELLRSLGWTPDGEE